MKASERGRGRSPGVGDGSPGSREAEGERGEGFYIAQSGKRADLLVIGGRALKTRILQLRSRQIDHRTTVCKSLMGVYLMGVYLMGVYLKDVYLMGVHLIGVHL